MKIYFSNTSPFLIFRKKSLENLKQIDASGVQITHHKEDVRAKN